MITLQENAVKFNNNLIVSHDGGRLSSDLEESERLIRENRDFNCRLSLISITYQGKVAFKIEPFLDKLHLSRKDRLLMDSFT
ncbi:hypothetical protein [Ruoffia tabacinasalis]|uniref:hypothetical protein n=1 Tax=Ruoffia tabacinasalis TaxID=87458 RepID=UPI0030D470B6